jgi:hypothetical protein
VCCWRNNKGARGHIRFGGPDGASDILGYFKRTGIVIAIEVKAPGKRPRPEQEAFLAAILRAGGFATWCDSVEQLDTTFRLWATGY